MSKRARTETDFKQLLADLAASVQREHEDELASAHVEHARKLAVLKAAHNAELHAEQGKFADLQANALKAAKEHANCTRLLEGARERLKGMREELGLD
eukprot:792098-Pleurochrysis_carterae.AAC.2